MRRTLRTLLGLTLAVVSLGSQAAPPQVLPEPNPTSLRGSALAQVSVRYPDGRLVVGGSLTWVDDAPVSYLARFSGNGVNDPAFAPPLNSNVDDLALDSQGRIYVMQRFSRAGSQPQALVVRVLDDAVGTLDPSFQFEAPAGHDFSGFALLIDEAAGVLYAATAPRNVFNRYTVTRHSLQTGARDHSFEVVVNGLVHDLQLVGDGLLIAGGFAEVAGVQRKAVARVDRVTGALDTNWNPGATTPATGGQTVRALLVDGGTHVFVGGPFNGLGNASSRGLARISLGDGTADPAWLRPVFGSLSAFARDSQGRLLAAGSISQVDGQARSSAVTRFNADGSLDAGYGQANDTRGSTVISLHVLSDDTVLTHAYFQGNDPTRLVRFDAATGLRQPLGTAALSGPASIRRLIPLPAGQGFLGVHNFGLIEGAATAGFVRLGADLAAVPGWRSGLGDIINFISPSGGAASTQHAYLIGLIFEPAGRSAARRVRLADGVVDAAWQPTGLSAPGQPTTNAIAIDEPGGFLYLSGSGGLNLNRFALSDGARDTSWAPSVGAASQISTSVLHGGFLYVAGSFNTVGGQALPRLARIAVAGTGAPDATWAPSPSAASVTALSLDAAGGWLYAGGSEANGQIYLRRISLLTGQPDPLWAPLQGRAGSITRLALSSERGELVVFGDIAVGCASERLPAVRLIGGARRVDALWKVQLNEFGSFSDGHILPTGDVLTAGNFERVNSATRPGLAALSSGDTIFSDGAGDTGGCVL
ncbi:MAG: delta-60 repeat domain-containing protein [Xanthomonadales bacterium]|nr:delta-60 repeat domain-containing protein [Xanthomonadales bacterium]